MTRDKTDYQESARSRRQTIRQLMIGTLICGLLVPLLFYLQFGEVGDLGWGATIFLVLCTLLSALGLYFQPRRQFHTDVPLQGDWLDRIGALWLVSCAFGPLLGWVITAFLPITEASWQWLYGLRAFFAAGLPIITALPLTRYVRGPSSWVALPILIGITAIAILSAVNVCRDLWEGPSVPQIQPNGRSEIYLRHTDKRLSNGR